MALMMPYTDAETGYTYPASVWLPMVDFGDFLARTLTIRFYGWASIEALAAGARPMKVDPYTVVLSPDSAPSVWEFIASPPVGDTLFDVRTNACYAAVAGHPFFAGAVDVPVNLLPPPPPVIEDEPAPEEGE